MATAAARGLMGARGFGTLCLLVTAVGWGLNWPIMKVILHDWPPLFARGIAGIVAGCALAALASARGERLRVPPGALGPLLLASFLNVFV